MKLRRLYRSVALCVFYISALQGNACPEQDAGQLPMNDIVISLNRMDPVAFSHVRHLWGDTGQETLKVTRFSCRDCHPKPFDKAAKPRVGMEVPHEDGGCAVCHDGRQRSDGKPAAFAATTRCLTCHKPSGD